MVFVLQIQYITLCGGSVVTFLGYKAMYSLTDSLLEMCCCVLYDVGSSHVDIDVQYIGKPNYVLV